MSSTEGKIGKNCIRASAKSQKADMVDSAGVSIAVFRSPVDPHAEDEAAAVHHVSGFSGTSQSCEIEAAVKWCFPNRGCLSHPGTKAEEEAFACVAGCTTQLTFDFPLHALVLREDWQSS